MTQTVDMSWLAILILAGGGLLLMLVVVAVVAAVSSKSKSGAGVAIAIVAALLLGVPLLGVLAFTFLWVGVSSRSLQVQPPPTVIESQAMPMESTMPESDEMTSNGDTDGTPPPAEPSLPEPAEAQGSN